jgi:hypothetical protein
MLSRLKLTGIRDQVDNLLDHAAKSDMTIREWLNFLCKREIAPKDLAAEPSIDPKQVRDLAAGRWICQGRERAVPWPAGRRQNQSYHSPRAGGDASRLLVAVPATAGGRLRPQSW